MTLLLDKVLEFCFFALSPTNTTAELIARFHPEKIPDEIQSATSLRKHYLYRLLQGHDLSAPINDIVDCIENVIQKHVLKILEEQLKKQLISDQFVNTLDKIKISDLWENDDVMNTLLRFLVKQLLHYTPRIATASVITLLTAFLKLKDDRGTSKQLIQLIDLASRTMITMISGNIKLFTTTPHNRQVLQNFMTGIQASFLKDLDGSVSASSTKIVQNLKRMNNILLVNLGIYQKLILLCKDDDAQLYFYHMLELFKNFSQYNIDVLMLAMHEESPSENMKTCLTDIETTLMNLIPFLRFAMEKRFLEYHEDPIRMSFLFSLEFLMYKTCIRFGKSLSSNKSFLKNVWNNDYFVHREWLTQPYDRNYMGMIIDYHTFFPSELTPAIEAEITRLLMSETDDYVKKTMKDTIAKNVHKYKSIYKSLYKLFTTITGRERLLKYEREPVNLENYSNSNILYAIMMESQEKIAINDENDAMNLVALWQILAKKKRDMGFGPINRKECIRQSFRLLQNISIDWSKDFELQKKTREFSINTSILYAEYEPTVLIPIQDILDYIEFIRSQKKTTLVEKGAMNAIISKWYEDMKINWKLTDSDPIFILLQSYMLETDAKWRNYFLANRFFTETLWQSNLLKMDPQTVIKMLRFYYHYKEQSDLTKKSRLQRMIRQINQTQDMDETSKSIARAINYMDGIDEQKLNQQLDILERTPLNKYHRGLLDSIKNKRIIIMQKKKTLPAPKRGRKRTVRKHSSQKGGGQQQEQQQPEQQQEQQQQEQEKHLKELLFASDNLKKFMEIYRTKQQKERGIFNIVGFLLRDREENMDMIRLLSRLINEMPPDPAFDSRLNDFFFILIRENSYHALISIYQWLDLDIIQRLSPEIISTIKEFDKKFIPLPLKEKIDRIEQQKMEARQQQQRPIVSLAFQKQQSSTIAQKYNTSFLAKINDIEVEKGQQYERKRRISNYVYNQLGENILQDANKEELHVISTGSFETGLDLPDGDLDFQVLWDTTQFSQWRRSDLKDLLLAKLFQLTSTHEHNGVFISSLGRFQSFRKNIPAVITFIVDDIMVDISLNIANADKIQRVKDNTERIRAFAAEHKLFRPIVMINKFLFKQYQLPGASEHGLSSYALTLMVMFFLMRNPAIEQSESPTLFTDALMAFFDFYGNQLVDSRRREQSPSIIKMQQNAISVRPQTHVTSYLVPRPDNKQQKYRDGFIFDTIFIENPIDPELNAAGGTLSMYHVFQQFFRDVLEGYRNKLAKQSANVTTTIYKQKKNLPFIQ